MKATTGQTIPVVGIPLLALFAMQIGVYGHAVRSLQFVYEFVRTGPVPFCVPPQGLERGRQLGGLASFAKVDLKSAIFMVFLASG